MLDGPRLSSSGYEQITVRQERVPAAKQIADGRRGRRCRNRERCAVEETRVIELVHRMAPRIVLVAAEVDDLACVEQRRMHCEHFGIAALNRNRGPVRNNDAAHVCLSL